MIDGLLVLALLAPLVPRPPSLVPLQDTTKGKAVYVKWCAGCHGDGGAGDGPSAAHMLPRPRNFTGAIYKIRSTASGQLPTDADLMRAIDEGLPGSAMPAWKGRLSDAERRDVAAYIKTFSSFFADTSQHVALLKFSGEPRGGTGANALKTGRQFYDSIGCRKCHGDQGRGDGPSAPTLKDDAGFPIFAADLHQSWRFRAGRHGCVGTGGARRPHARAAGELGRPHPEPRQRVARIRATRARDRGRRRLGPAPPQGGALARPAGGAVPPPPPPGHGAALLPDGERDGPGLPVALDEPAAPQRRRAGPRERAVRHPPRGAGGAGELRSRRVAAG